MKREKKVKTGPERRERALKLIEAAGDGKLSEKLHKRLLYWFLNIPEDGIAEDALAEWAERNIKPDTAAPSKKEIAAFRKIACLLGIENGKYRSKAVKRPFIAGHRFMLASAAVVIPVLVTVGALLLFNKGKAPAIETIVLYADHESGREMFTLPDGSNVTLRNGSKLEYRSDFVSARCVSIDGQGFFDVTCNPDSPFKVSHEGFSVTVLGTEFDVRAYSGIDEAEVVLVSGKVEVEVGEHRKELVPGQRVLLDKAKRNVLEYSQAGPGKIMRVSGNDLRIEDMHANEALAVIADYFDKVLVIAPDLMATKAHLNIILPHDISIEAAIASLNTLSQEAKCIIDEDTIYVSKK